MTNCAATSANPTVRAGERIGSSWDTDSTLPLLPAGPEQARRFVQIVRERSKSMDHADAEHETAGFSSRLFRGNRKKTVQRAPARQISVARRAISVARRTI